MQKDHEQNKLVGILQKITVVSIGPFTADELKKLNVKNVIADVHTVPGSVEAIYKAFSLAKAI
jgi:uroporphyrinogen-III synthase